MRLPLLAAPLALSTLAAHADTLTTFDLNVTLAQTLNYGTSVTGTITVDESLGIITNVNVTSGGRLENFGYILSQGQSGTGYTVDTAGTDTDLFDFFIPTLNLGTYTGSPITGTLASMPFAGTLTVTPVSPAATPEPSSIALLGTGLVGMFGVARRKFQTT